MNVKPTRRGKKNRLAKVSKEPSKPPVARETLVPDALSGLVVHCSWYTSRAGDRVTVSHTTLSV